ncbi:MAG: enolase C-terminal domain-like protein [Bacilli bacterium]
MVNFEIAKLTAYVVPFTLHKPFRTRYGVLTTRELLLLRIESKCGLNGWGESAAFLTAWYADETIEDDLNWLKEHWPIIQRCRCVNDWLTWMPYLTHPFAAAAVEMALIRLECAHQQKTLAEYFGTGESNTLTISAAVGSGTFDEMTKSIQQAVTAGYRFFKLKYVHGDNVTKLARLLDSFPNCRFAVDVNGGMQWPEGKVAIDQLRQLPLRYIEQPVSPMHMHSVIEAYRSQTAFFAWDESSVAYVTDVASRPSGAYVSLKPGRFGGVLRTQKVANQLIKKGDRPFIGGMIESMVAKEMHAALAAAWQTSAAHELTLAGQYFDDTPFSPKPTLSNGKLHTATYRICEDALQRFCSAEWIQLDLK